MTFDNSKTLIKLRLRLFAATLVMLVYVYLVYFGEQLKFPVFGIEEVWATLVLTVIYLLLAFLPLILKYKYLYFSDDGTSIIFRYYSIGLFSGKKNSVEIPKDEFLDYRIKKSFLGLVKSVRLYRLIKNKRASYSPIYLSSLNKTELSKISTALNKYKA